MQLPCLTLKKVYSGLVKEKEKTKLKTGTEKTLRLFLAAQRVNMFYIMSLSFTHQMDSQHCFDTY